MTAVFCRRCITSSAGERAANHLTRRPPAAAHPLAGPFAASLALTLLLLLHPEPAAAQNCAAQLSAAAATAGTSMTTEWVDPTTPDAACTAQVCTGDYATCNVVSPPLSTMQLVFSDEFDTDGQSFAASANNSRWTAENMWYAATQDWEVYTPEQVWCVWGGEVGGGLPPGSSRRSTEDFLRQAGGCNHKLWVGGWLGHPSSLQLPPTAAAPPLARLSPPSHR